MSNKEKYFTLQVTVDSVNQNTKDFWEKGCKVLDKSLSLACNYSKRVALDWYIKDFKMLDLNYFSIVQEIIYKYSNICKIIQRVYISDEFEKDYLKSIKSRYGLDLNLIINEDNISYIKNNSLKDFNGVYSLTLNLNSDYNEQDLKNINVILAPQKCNLVSIKAKDCVQETKDVSSLGETYEMVYKNWIRDVNANFYNREFIELLNLIIGSKNNLCDSDCRCNVLSIDLKGDINPCYRINKSKFKPGNVSDFASMEEVFDASQYKRYSFETQKRLLTVCNKCNYFAFCEGGCNAKLLESKEDITEVKEEYCVDFKAKLSAMYNVFRDVDIYDNFKTNFKLTKILIKRNIFSVSEIKEVMVDKGVTKTLDYDKENLLSSIEFNLFTLFNSKKSRSLINLNIGDDNVSFADSRIKEKRKEALSKLFDYYYMEIINILNIV